MLVKSKNAACWSGIAVGALVVCSAVQQYVYILLASSPGRAAHCALLWPVRVCPVQERFNGNQMLLFDPVTRLLYMPPADPSTGWPELYARLDRSSNVVPIKRPRPRDLFDKLDKYLKERRVRLDDVRLLPA